MEEQCKHLVGIDLVVSVDSPGVSRNLKVEVVFCEVSCGDKRLGHLGYSLICLIWVQILKRMSEERYSVGFIFGVTFNLIKSYLDC